MDYFVPAALLISFGIAAFALERFLTHKWGKPAPRIPARLLLPGIFVLVIAQARLLPDLPTPWAMFSAGAAAMVLAFVYEIVMWKRT